MENSAMREIPVLGVLPPAFMALGIACGVIDLHIASHALWIISLIFTALGLALSVHTRRLFSRI